VKQGEVPCFFCAEMVGDIVIANKSAKTANKNAGIANKRSKVANKIVKRANKTHSNPLYFTVTHKFPTQRVNKRPLFNRHTQISHSTGK
jgi:hypothetical protein